MANPLDTDAGSELFSGYEAELKLVQADLAQKLDQIPEVTGEPRKAAISQAERAVEEAEELVCFDPPSFLSALGDSKKRKIAFFAILLLQTPMAGSSLFSWC